ncbi:MAG TPA: SprB repeat-containing protein, partial [Flavobacteriales bacterium]|nr:SprB repeat-containing protein [Flavobacteriales bacterium]
MRLPLFLLLAASATRLFGITVNAYAWEETCGYGNGQITVTVSGGTPPYTYAWADGPTTQDRTGLVPGTYTVTVTDAVGSTDDASATVVAINTLRPWTWSMWGAQLTCPFDCQGQVTMGL